MLLASTISSGSFLLWGSWRTTRQLNKTMPLFRVGSGSIHTVVGRQRPGGTHSNSWPPQITKARVATAAATASQTVTPVPQTKGTTVGGGLVAVSEDPQISGDNIRKRFLEFFAARGHAILPSSSLVPEDPTVLLTIAGMLQFKPIFLGQVSRQVPCATTSQKCARTNDVQNVGRTARHHTFFEMLGNFSFGDYFKREAIKWAWELATVEFKLPVERLWVSVYEEDDEAYAIWRDEVGVLPARIKRMGAEDNFWSSGPTGPCGPCSEMYFDFFPERGNDPSVTLEDDERFIEFYNLVFMQYNRLDDGALEPLRNRNIDTGMGLERMARILQKVDSNYETDLMYPLLQCAARLAKMDYETADEKTKMQLKVVADHTRAVVFLISDGVIPSNIGRGYVTRRLLRRIVRIARLLGIDGDGQGNPDGSFLPTIAEVVVGMSAGIDPDVKKNAPRIYEELRREELQFRKTLARGDRMLEELLEQARARAVEAGSRPRLAGKDVFTLYDTYGFPVEITEEVAEERGADVDLEGFEAEMELQRKRAQAARNEVKLAMGGAAADLGSQLPATTFLGYTELRTESTVAALVCGGSVVDAASLGEEVDIVLDQTPFYAESGGQIGDNGLLVVLGSEGESVGVLKVRDVQKGGGELSLHRARVEDGEVRVGSRVEAVVDQDLRKRAQAHHTATHLLQAALKQVVGNETSQAGSLVAFDRLRFDFNCPRGLTDDEVARIESLVNGWIAAGTPLETRVMPLAEAKEAGAIMMFGEKYGEVVRVVDVPGVSKELCGGTHVRNTAEIQGLRVVSEQGIASGVRRIEAVAGPAAIEFLTRRDTIISQLSTSLKVKAEEIPVRVASLQDEVRSVRAELADAKASLALAKAQLLISKAEPIGASATKVLVATLDGVEPEPLKVAAEKLVESLGDPSAVVLGSSFAADKVSLVAAFSPSVNKAGVQAGKFIGAIAKICGGGGGGRPNLAQAGGKQPSKLPEAMEKAKLDLVAALK